MPRWPGACNGTKICRGTVLLLLPLLRRGLLRAVTLPLPETPSAAPPRLLGLPALGSPKESAPPPAPSTPLERPWLATWGGAVRRTAVAVRWAADRRGGGRGSQVEGAPSSRPRCGRRRPRERLRRRQVVARGLAQRAPLRTIRCCRSAKFAGKGPYGRGVCGRTCGVGVAWPWCRRAHAWPRRGRGDSRCSSLSVWLVFPRPRAPDSTPPPRSVHRNPRGLVL